MISGITCLAYKPDFDFKKIKINDIGKYSITRPYEAKQIINIIKNEIKKILGKESNMCVVTDGTCGVGGDTIHLCKYFKKVNAIDIIEENTNLLIDNCKIFGINNINILKGDYTKLFNEFNEDLVYLDPPWGGINYKNFEKIKIELSNIELSKFIKLMKHNGKKDVLIFIKLPLNVDLDGLDILHKYNIYNKKNILSFYLVQLQN